MSALCVTTGPRSVGGDNETGEASPPPERFSAISSGTNHTCALRASDGMAVCWGSNRDPDGQRARYRGQATPPYGETFVAISSGFIHTCALRSDGEAVCWGETYSLETEPPEGGTVYGDPKRAQQHLRVGYGRRSRVLGVGLPRPGLTTGE